MKNQKASHPLTDRIRVLKKDEYFAIVQDNVLYILAPEDCRTREHELVKTVYSHGLSRDNVQIWYGKIQEEGPIFENLKSIHEPEASMASESLDEILIKMKPFIMPMGCKEDKNSRMGIDGAVTAISAKMQYSGMRRKYN